MQELKDVLKIVAEMAKNNVWATVIILVLLVILAVVFKKRKGDAHETPPKKKKTHFTASISYSKEN